MKGITAADPFGAHPTTLEEAVALDSLKSVVGTTRCEPTRGWKPGEPLLIATDQHHSESFAHRSIARPNKSRTSSCIRTNEAVEPSTFTMTIVSNSLLRIWG